MAFISPNLAKHDIHFQIGDDLGSDHLPIELLMLHHTGIRLLTKFDQTDREVFESTLEAALGSEDFSELTSTSDLDKFADFIIFSISTARYKTSEIIVMDQVQKYMDGPRLLRMRLSEYITIVY